MPPLPVLGRIHAVAGPGATEPEDEAERHEREHDRRHDPAHRPERRQPDDQERDADHEADHDGHDDGKAHPPRVRRRNHGNTVKAMLRLLATRVLATGALTALALGLYLAVDRGLGGSDTTSTKTVATVAPRPTPRPAPRPRPRPARLVPLAAAGAYDPEGDGRERDEEARFAVDGRRDTSWRTERYSSFFKSGVGLVLDARRRVRVEQVVVETPTPGFRAEIRLGSKRTGPFVRASPARTLTARTRFPVAKRAGRYVVLWVVELPPGTAGAVSEVRLSARG